ncbi:MAG: DUF5689 domain-containing protein [Prevotellaceae bacterium]|nr:DUF5689 domain-containing protein [Prevotellaceae bacterium]
MKQNFKYKIMKTFIKRQITSLVAVIATVLSITSCVDNKFDFPIEDLYDHGLVANISIADLKAMYQNATVEITADLIVEGNVCSSDKEGNIFKTLYIQDATGGLPIVIDQNNISNNYRLGRKVLVKLKGLYLGSYNGLIQLGMAPNAGEASPSRIPATLTSNYIVKDYEVAEVQPEIVTIEQITNRSELVGKLVKINDVQFASPDATYATADANTNRVIEDRNANTIILRNSSYATFALLPMPEGSGSITAVLSLHVTGSARTYQLLIRDTTDVEFYSPRFGSGSGGPGTGEIILRETFGNSAVQSGTAWPAVTSYDGYLKEGKGAAAVTYTSEGGAVTVRSNASSSGYTGSSGECNAMMAANGASLLINDIATCGANNFVLSFGSNETAATLAVAYKINGTSNWVPITYTKNSTEWGLASTTVTLPNGTNTIKLRFTASATQYGTRVDDVRLTTEDQTSNPIIDPDGGGSGGGDEDGTENNPYSVADGIANQGATTDSVWTQGYIVGCVKHGVSSVASASDVTIGVGSGWDSQTNVLIADSPDETDYTKCIVVNLPSGKPLRTQVNLVTHPENYKKTLKVKGVLRTYFGIAGLRDCPGETSDFTLDGQGGSGGGNYIFNETLLTQTSFDMFTKVNVNGAQEWKFDAAYGAGMSGYANNSSYANEDWFISPAIDLSSYSSAKLTFEHARGPAASITVGIAQGWYKVYVSNNYSSGNPSTATWTELTGVNHPTTAWTPVSSGELTIPAANMAANCRVAFRYECSDTESATWEIKNIIVQE